MSETERKTCKYKPEQLRTWAHMVHVGTHDSLEEPPYKLFFRGKRPFEPRTASSSTTPERKKAAPVYIPFTGQASQHTQRSVEEMPGFCATSQKQPTMYNEP